MKEIKFCGISINTNKMIYSETLSSGTIKRKKDCKYLEINEKWIGVIPESVGQLLGYDHNGNEIYSNSKLIDDEGILHKLEWRENELRWMLLFWCGNNDWDWDAQMEDYYSCKDKKFKHLYVKDDSRVLEDK